MKTNSSEWVCGQKLWNTDNSWIACVGSPNHPHLQHDWDVVCIKERSYYEDDVYCKKLAKFHADNLLYEEQCANEYASTNLICDLAQLASWADFQKMEGNSK